MARIFRWASVWGAGLAAVAMAGSAQGGVQEGQNSGGWGQGIARYALDKECHTQLSQRTEWQAARLVLSQAQQTRLENKICACAAAETAKQLSTLDVLKLISEQQRQKAITDVSVNIVAECSKQLIFNR